MATKKLSELPLAGTYNGSEYLLGMQNGLSTKFKLGGTTNASIVNLDYAATITPTTNTSVRIIATGNLIINAPAAGADGDLVRLWITASGADRTLSLQNTIKVPRTSTFTSPQTILSGEKARLTIQYDATRVKWEIVTFVNGY